MEINIPWVLNVFESIQYEKTNKSGFRVLSILKFNIENKIFFFLSPSELEFVSKEVNHVQNWIHYVNSILKIQI